MNPLKKNDPYKTSSRLKADARQSLLGNLSICVWSIVICLLLNSVIAGITANVTLPNAVADFIVNFLITLVVSTFTGLIELGLMSIFLDLQFGQIPHFSDLFLCFRNGSDRAVLISLFLNGIPNVLLIPLSLLISIQKPSVTARAVLIILTAVCAVLLIGFMLSYLILPFLFLDFPDLRAAELIRQSRRVMRGHKKRLLYILISFVPLFLLGALSFGIADLWVTAYLCATLAAFYRDLMTAK